ncbi:MAG: DNA-directed RNA polymerase subunit G [Candidatus Helarchaeales archaeon]
MIDLSLSVDRVETPKAAGMKILYLSSKDKEVEIKLDIPERLITFDTTKEVNMKIAKKKDNLSDEKAKVFGHGTVEYMKRKEDKTELIIMIGGIPFKLVIPAKMNEFSLNDEVDVGIF